MLRKTQGSQSRRKSNVDQIMQGVVLSLTASLFLIPYNALAHHSFTVDVGHDKPGTIEDVITEVWFRNLHVRCYLEVTDRSGQKTVWDAQGSSASLLVRKEWTADSIKIGDKVTIHSHFGKSETLLFGISKIVMSDDTV